LTQHSHAKYVKIKVRGVFCASLKLTQHSHAKYVKIKVRGAFCASLKLTQHSPAKYVKIKVRGGSQEKLFTIEAGVEGNSVC